MKQITTFILSLTIIFLLSACGDSDDLKYQELAWDDLRPPQELVEDENSKIGSLDIIDDYYSDEFIDRGIYSGAPPQAFSSGVVAELDGKDIRVPGFVVPVEFNSDKKITEFFLVPFFGACYHKPPPPPNQTIYVTSAVPIEYGSIYDPVWIMGAIKTEQTGNDIATAAYTMDLHRMKPYEQY